MPLPILGSWISGLRNAWNEAKEDFRMSKASGTRKSIKPGASKRNDTRLRRQKLSSMSRFPNTSNTEKSVFASAATSISQAGDDSTNHDQLNDLEPGSILDANFLRDIEGTSKRKWTSEMGPPKLSSKGDREGISSTPGARTHNHQTVRIVDTEGKGTMFPNNKRPHSALSSTADCTEEYIAHVHKRVRQLEEELEIARSRLRIYEASDRARKGVNSDSPVNVTLEVACTDAEPEDAKVLPGDNAGTTSTENSGSRFSTTSETSRHIYLTESSPEQSSRSYRDHVTPERIVHGTQGGTENADLFVLSPVKMDFSPVRVEPADVSNGEIARREALQALKRRIQTKSVSSDSSRT